MTVPLGEFRWADFSSVRALRNDGSSEGRTFAHPCASAAGALEVSASRNRGVSSHLRNLALSKHAPPKTLGLVFRCDANASHRLKETRDK